MIRLIDNWFTRHNLKRYTANTMWLLSEKVLRIFLSFFVGVYVARRIGPEQTGLLNYALSFSGIFAVLIDIGMNQLIIRELVKRPDKTGEIMGTTLLLRIVGFVLMMILIVLVIWFMPGDKAANILILIIAAGYFFQALQIPEFYFQSHVKGKYIAIVQVSSLLIYSMVRFFCAYYMLSLEMLALAELLFMFFTSIGYWHFYKQIIPRNITRMTVSKEMCLYFLKNSWPLFLSGSFIAINTRVDQIMIKNMVGNADVGFYSIAVRLVELFYFIPMTICASLFPAVINSKNISVEFYKSRVIKLFSLMFYLSLCITFFLSVSCHLIINVLYGYAFIPAAAILAIYSWRLIFVSWGIAKSYYLLSENLQGYGLVFDFLTATTNIAITYFLIRHYSIQGAAWATLISSLQAVIIYPALFKATRETVLFHIKSLNVSRIFKTELFRH